MHIARGSTVTLLALSAGAVVTPDSVSFRLDYPSSDRTRTEVTVAGALDAGTTNWSATWNSSVAFTGTVFVSVLVTAGTTKIVDDGEFQLTANPANPDP